MEVVTDYSLVDRKNVVITVLALLFFFVLLAFTGYKWLIWQIRQPVEIFFEVLFIFVLLERALPKYCYEITDSLLRITKYGFWRQQTVEIPYGFIFSVYSYKPQLIGIISFRRTYRMHSALDRRKVWTVAYHSKGRKGKQENHRLYFKPSDQALDGLRNKIPREHFLI